MKAEKTTPRRWVRTAIAATVVALGLATSAGAASALEARQTSTTTSNEWTGGWSASRGIRW